MDKNQILVRNISHLTDARYFAAMGVDWISMELNNDPASFMKWHTLRDWVAGVKLVAEINTADEMLLAKTIIDAVPDGIVAQGSGVEMPSGIKLFFEATFNEEPDAPMDSFIILRYDPSREAERYLSMNSRMIFLQSDWTTDTLGMLLKTGYAGGICFSGGEEAATGMRDYELMDQLLSLLSH